MRKRILKTAAVQAGLLVLVNAHMWAIGTGTLSATRAIVGLSGEVSGPIAYGASLIAIVGTAISWYRHHHDMGALSQGALGAIFVAGCALGGSSLLGIIPGVSGALI